MSKKTELQADLQRINYILARAHLTQESRSGTFKNFAEAMRELHYGIHCAAQIGGKHLQAYIRYRSESGIVSLTLAKEMGHLRAVLRHIGKQGLADNPAYSNRSLGIAQGSRKGTKEPLSDAELRGFRNARSDWAGQTWAQFWRCSEHLDFAQSKRSVPAGEIRFCACTANLSSEAMRASSRAPKAGACAMYVLRMWGGLWKLCEERWRYWKPVDESISWLAPRALKPPD
jgi:hypothetical protein